MLCSVQKLPTPLIVLPHYAGVRRRHCFRYRSDSRWLQAFHDGRILDATALAMVTPSRLVLLNVCARMLRAKSFLACRVATQTGEYRTDGRHAVWLPPALCRQPRYSGH